MLDRAFVPLICTLLLGQSSAAIGASVGGRQAPDGTAIHCDLPGQYHLRNKGGSDGKGLCVFTSIAHSARYQEVPELIDFRDWMTRYPGGGYPEKVAQKIKQICAEKGVPEPKYLQYEGKDLEILKLACQSGRMPGVTYRYSPTGRYGGQKIWHMVSLVHADDRWFAVLDNNYPGVNLIEWMTPNEFRPVFTEGGGWAVVLLNPGPPPAPTN